MTDTTKERAQFEKWQDEIVGTEAWAFGSKLEVSEMAWMERAKQAEEQQTRAMKVAIDYGERVASTEQSTETPPTAKELGEVIWKADDDWKILQEHDGLDRNADWGEFLACYILTRLAEAPRPVGTPEKCPECDSTDRRMHGFISHGALVTCDDPWHRGPVGTPEYCPSCGNGKYARGCVATRKGHALTHIPNTCDCVPCTDSWHDGPAPQHSANSYPPGDVWKLNMEGRPSTNTEAGPAPKGEKKC